MVDEVEKLLDKVGPGTAQVNLGVPITMVMVIIAWIVVEYTSFKAPEYVWTAITGLILYAAQYWHGPRKSG